MTSSMNKIRQHGFTLLEIAMVLFIVALLLAGLVPTITSQMEQQRANETRKKISEIKEALIGYALRTGTLPCPARGDIATGQAGAGDSILSCNNTGGNYSFGVVPWVTLGTSETDGWGNRFTYRVAADFADSIASNTNGACTPSPAPTQATFGLCSNGNMMVKSAASGGTNVATFIPAVIISHGKNGAGAFTMQGKQVPANSNADEQENTNHGSDANYVSHPQTTSFDDLVDWITPYILYNRMVAAGKLP